MTVTITELIERLSEIRERHGDLRIVAGQSDNSPDFEVWANRLEVHSLDDCGCPW